MGTNVDGTSVWDQLASNDYISDYYTNTPVSYGFSPPIPMCGSTTTTSSPPNSIPSATSYQITIPGATNGSVNERSGPGTSYSIVGTMGDGTSIQIACQTMGTNVDGTSVWDQLASNDYISDYYTNTPTVDGFTSSIPQCTSVPTIPSTPTAPTSSWSPLHGQTVSTNPFNESGYCTWYAEVRFHDYVINFPSAYPANNSYIDVTGNAKLWATSAQKHGWTVTTTPTVNSIVVFQPGENGVTNSAGHVAWVTAVNGSHFTVLELNDVLANGAANTGFAPDRNPYYHAGSGVSFILIPT
jgi:surface antigen